MKSAPSPRPRPLTPRRLLALIAALACGWAAYSLYGEAAQDRALAASVAQLQSANTTLQQQIAERSLEIEEAQGSAWVEEQARKLGFHLPGESIYVVVPSGRQGPSSGGINAAPPTYSPTPVPTPTPSPGVATGSPGSTPDTGTPTPSPISITVPAPTASPGR